MRRWFMKRSDTSALIALHKRFDCFRGGYTCNHLFIAVAFVKPASDCRTFIIGGDSALSDGDFRKAEQARAPDSKGVQRNQRYLLGAWNQQHGLPYQP